MEQSEHKHGGSVSWNDLDLTDVINEWTVLQPNEICTDFNFVASLQYMEVLNSSSKNSNYYRIEQSTRKIADWFFIQIQFPVIFWVVFVNLILLNILGIINLIKVTQIQQHQATFFQISSLLNVLPGVNDDLK